MKIGDKVIVNYLGNPSTGLESIVNAKGVVVDIDKEQDLYWVHIPTLQHEVAISSHPALQWARENMINNGKLLTNKSFCCDYNHLEVISGT